ncbi:DUF5691 domain-containing protein [Neolewinella litorea]|uniref:Uncharacterized protein n=1 Tax=Neolewinella litorea TaxID=2562452 RepID=A0A4S4NP46_9BACT|nr:DUF5691 domain-containing protein [Neolewinella litorea]THH41799.1 hypothetical protein E4021_04205 [Neolewinella litorea]
MAAPPPPYRELLHALTLGTARRSLDPAVMKWLDERGAIDPVADAPEQLLAAWALVERSERVRDRPLGELPTTTAIAPPETLAAPTPRLARGLQLMLEGTYAQLLDEGINLLLAAGAYLPHALLPALLPRAAAVLDEEPERAARWMRATGNRGPWLAAQHPDWAPLGPNFDYPAAWRREDQPGKLATLLARWRRADPAAAREALARSWGNLSPRSQEITVEGLRTNLSEADWPWLRESLVPKRKGVRRTLAALLLQSGEPAAREDFLRIARSVCSADEGRKGNTLDSQDRGILKAYGGVKAPQTIRQRLLQIMPPPAWIEVSGQALSAFWAGLPVLELREAGRAISDYGDPETRTAFLRYLLHEEPQQFPREVAADLIRQLTATEFEELYEELLTRRDDALRLRGLPRFLALQRPTAWNERLTKAMVRRLLDDLHNRQLDYTTQRDLGLHWQQSIPLLDPEVFPWLRQQLHTTAERPDAFGKLATQMLQTTSFRRQLRQP